MLMKWLKPTIDKRVVEVSHLSEKTQDYIQFITKFNECFDALIKQSNQNDQVKLFELEATMNIMLISSIEIAYTEGLSDGIKVAQKLYKIR